jgi:hypothetical protein
MGMCHLHVSRSIKFEASIAIFMTRYRIVFRKHSMNTLIRKKFVHTRLIERILYDL